MNRPADMEEINLLPSGKSASRTPARDAGNKAAAVQRNGRFFCSRVGAEVGPGNCKAKYTYAKSKKVTLSPCLECATVQMMMRKEPYIVPAKEEAPKMGLPAKKEEVETGSLFDGWEAYDPHSVRKSTLNAFASVSQSAIALSSGAVTLFDLDKIKTVNLYTKGSLLRIALYSDNSGKLKLTKEDKKPNRKPRTSISSAGIINRFGGIDGMKSKRFKVVEVAPGCLEVNFEDPL